MGSSYTFYTEDCATVFNKNPEELTDPFVIFISFPCQLTYFPFLVAVNLHRID